MSEWSRELLLARSTQAGMLRARRRNPEAKAIMDALRVSGLEISASGNNLNQIARRLNTTGDLRDWNELREALEENRRAAELIKRAAARVLDL